jgi:hypothetical protein
MNTVLYFMHFHYTHTHTHTHTHTPHTGLQGLQMIKKEF